MNPILVPVGGKRSPDYRTVLPALLAGNILSEIPVAGSGEVSWGCTREALFSLKVLMLGENNMTVLG